MKFSFFTITFVTAIVLCFSCSKNDDVPEPNPQQSELNKHTDIGTIGMLNGREAIVVDLGGTIGKVAIATMNVGATSVDKGAGTDSQASCYGKYFTFAQAQDLNSADFGGIGWYIPSKDELYELSKKLTWNESKGGCEWKVTDKATLFFPAAGTEDEGKYYDRALYGYYRSSSKKGTNSGLLIFSKDKVYTFDDTNVIGMSVRPFCALK